MARGFVLVRLIYFQGCLVENSSVNSAMIVAERCRTLLFDVLCDGSCREFIIRRRFDFLAAADILRVRCRLSVDFVCEIICFIYI